jgi:dihydrofolate reductase
VHARAVDVVAALSGAPADTGRDPRLALVVAIATNGVIGRAGALPWHLPDDLKHFKAVTLGKPVLMGRRTFESIGRPLPGRRNLVLTQRCLPGSPQIERVPDLSAALERTRGAAELCVIGGAQLYAVALPLCTRIYLTRVHACVDGDVFFPPMDWSGWTELERRDHPADARHAHALSFVQLERAESAQPNSG